MSASNPSLFHQAVLPLFETHRADWLAQARSVARNLAAGGRMVTINDVRRQCPPPPHVDPRVCGAVFAGKEWERVGFLNSDRKACHHRPISMFRLRVMGG